MKPTVIGLAKARQDLINIINIFPVEKREQIIFDKWSLKDLVGHISGWDILTVEVLKNIKQNKLSKWLYSVDEMNKISVQARKPKPWKTIYEEFINASQELVNQYSSIPGDLWEKPLFSGKKFNAAKFLKIDLDHYLEHLEQIKEKS